MSNPKQHDLYDAARMPFSADWEEDAARLLNEKHSAKALFETIRLEARYGDSIALLRAFLGNAQKAQLIELCIEDLKGEETDAIFALLLDFLDGVVDEIVRSKGHARLPLDFTKRSFEGFVIYARSEQRHFEAERMADSLLQNADAKRTVN